MPDFGKALRGLKPATASWQWQLANYVVAGFSPRTVLPPGEIQANALGSHYMIHSAYPHDHFHGKVGLNRLSSADLASLITLMREKAIVPHRDRIVFLDTETTGMPGGTGICPFLVGLG